MIINRKEVLKTILDQKSKELEQKDLEILKTREKKYIPVRIISRNITTEFGPLSYKRRIYKYHDERTKRWRYVALLDQELGIKKWQKLQWFFHQCHWINSWLMVSIQNISSLIFQITMKKKEIYRQKYGSGVMEHEGSLNFIDNHGIFNLDNPIWMNELKITGLYGYGDWKLKFKDENSNEFNFTISLFNKFDDSKTLVSLIT